MSFRRDGEGSESKAGTLRLLPIVSLFPSSGDLINLPQYCCVPSTSFTNKNKDENNSMIRRKRKGRRRNSKTKYEKKEKNVKIKTLKYKHIAKGSR